MDAAARTPYRGKTKGRMLPQQRVQSRVGLAAAWWHELIEADYLWTPRVQSRDCLARGAAGCPPAGAEKSRQSGAGPGIGGRWVTEGNSLHSLVLSCLTREGLL